MSEHRKGLKQSKKIVIKLGSSVLTNGQTELVDEVFKRFAKEIAQIKKNGVQCVLVSSGSIVAGKSRLKLTEKNLTIPEKQAAAAVGQSHLIQKYERFFSPLAMTTAQILLTHNDLSDRTRYLNARHTLSTLLQKDVIPIINENDSVIVEEIKFGDNDTLSAYISSLIEADLLILLTDCDGFFDKDPKKDKKAKRLSLVETIDEGLEKAASAQAGPFGVGGMQTKIVAASKAASHGIPTVIANGQRPGVLQKILQGEDEGTLFLAKEDRLTSRKHWIAHVLRPSGMIIVDEGAEKAIRNLGKSLLPSGILQAKGPFDTGDVVAICNQEKKVFAQGLTNYAFQELEKICGIKSSEIESILGYKYYDEVIHRDDLVLV